MIEKELDKLLKKRSDFIGKIYPYYKRGIDSERIARKVGHKNSSSITVFTTTLDYLFKRKPIDYKMWKSIEQLEYRLKEWNTGNHSTELNIHFHNLIEECAKRGDKSIFFNPSHPPQEQLSKTQNSDNQNNSNNSAQAYKQPGVYVYSYPQYLLAEAFDSENKTLLKIGASGNVDRRVERQSRQTEVPEDLVTLRVFLTEDPFKIEEYIHNILIAAGHHHKTTSGGVEWFRTNLATIDAIAKALQLDNSAPSIPII